MRLAFLGAQALTGGRRSAARGGSVCLGAEVIAEGRSCHSPVEPGSPCWLIPSLLVLRACIAALLFSASFAERCFALCLLCVEGSAGDSWPRRRPTHHQHCRLSSCPAAAWTVCRPLLRQFWLPRVTSSFAPGCLWCWVRALRRRARGGFGGEWASMHDVSLAAAGGAVARARLRGRPQPAGPPPKTAVARV